MIDISTADQAGSAVHDEVPNNVCYDWGHGNKDAVDAAFAKAATSARWSSSTTG